MKGANMNFLTMNVYVNAWLDCHHPYIAVHNKNDGDVMAFFNSTKVNQLIESGEVSIEDFESSDENTRAELISTLLRVKFTDSVEKENKDKKGSSLFSSREMMSNSVENLLWL